MTPFGTVSAASPARSSAISASACASGSGEGLRVILIVEDDPHVARLIALVLQRHGRDCQIVADGQTALARAKELRPSMIFADLTIKGMGGQDLCNALKGAAETKAIPYIILSGDRDIAQKARQCGADDFLGKPFEFPDLIRLVDKYATAES